MDSSTGGEPLPLPPLVTAARGGVLTTRWLLENGSTRREVERLVRSGTLVRVGEGALVVGTALAGAAPEQRHLLTARALQLTWPRPVALSHGTAAIAHGLPLLPVPERVHAVRLDGAQSRSRQTFRVHRAYPGATAVPRGDSRVIGLPWAVLGVTEEGLEAAVVAGDAALHRQLVTRGQLLEVAAVQPRRRGSGTLGRAVARMDPACEPPGESLSRLLLGRLGFRVRSQVQLVDRYGAFLARVDFLVEGSRVVVEFDGLGKYATPDDLRREKLRQERLEREGYVVVRLVWGDLQHPAEVDARIRRALARAGSARRPSPAARAGHRKR